jgi:hypothetical protein
MHHLIIIFWIFCITKALTDSLKHDYPAWKSRLGIPNKWDWYFDPSISYLNKKRNWIWGLITPVSDAWHTLWTIPQIGYIIYAVIILGWVNGLLVAGVGGVFVIFNGIYAFMRKKPYI